MSITLSEQYDLFIARLDRNIEEIDSSLIQVRKNIIYNMEMIKRMCAKYPDSFAELKLDDVSTSDLSKYYTIIARIKKYRAKSKFKSRGQLMKTNLKELISSYRDLNNKVKSLKFYMGLKAKINRESYKGLIQNTNFEIVRIILSGERYSFGKGLGSIKIFGIERRKQEAIDWGSTMKYKKELIKEGHEVYNQKNNPDGIKYHILYDLGIHYWWIWTKRACFYPNRRYYTFIPTNYNNTESRLKDEFLKDVKEPDDIINTVELGNVQKMQFLLDHFEDYHLNYKLLCTP